MTGMPPETLYHRTLGWHAPALRRTALVAALGLLVAILLLAFTDWELALLGGWDAAALAFLATTWPIIIRVDGAHTRLLATREDETRGSSALMLLGACVASLLGVGYALGQAGHRGSPRVALIAAAVLTVVLSWTVLNTVYTLHYTHLYYGSAAEGIEFGDAKHGTPDYRDFAYIALTIGMTYQVSDTTLRHPRIRRTVLVHALLSYLFGVVIVAGSVNLVSGLVR